MNKFARFVGVGALGFFLSFGLLLFFTNVLSFHYLVSTALSFISVNFLTFLLQKRYTFVRSQGLFLFQLLRYYGVVTAGFLGNIFGMYILVDTMQVSLPVASIILAAIFTGVHFLAHDHFTFRN